MACATSFVLILITGPRVIAILRALKAGQPLREAAVVHKLAELHEGKRGTPTMGGLLIIGSILISCLLWARLSNPFVHSALVVLLGAGALGFADDYLKIKKKSADGVAGRVKLIALGSLAIIVCGYLLYRPDTGGPESGRYAMTREVETVAASSHARSTDPAITTTSERVQVTGHYLRQLWLPLVKQPVLETMPWWFALPFFVFIIMGASNAVNLTDGLDGLAAGCTINAATAYSLLAWIAGNTSVASYLYLPSNPLTGELGVFTMALVGASFGFLWYNAHPARVFMGDTGSLAIGASLGLVAICVRHEFLLVLIGGIFVMEALSVILQVASFKMTGKRIFRMAPIHHHFELAGWKENQVIVRFWILSMLMALAGIATLKIR